MLVKLVFALKAFVTARTLDDRQADLMHLPQVSGDLVASRLKLTKFTTSHNAWRDTSP